MKKQWLNILGLVPAFAAAAMMVFPVPDAHAAAPGFSWSRQGTEEGTVLDARALWPDAESPVITAVYRDGISLPDASSVTVSSGSVYHFRGKDGDRVLYMQVYPEGQKGVDISSGTTGTWYNLLPSSIRESFESSGWEWEMTDGNLGRAYLDTAYSKIMVKEGDGQAVLYGMGLYLDHTNRYRDDPAFAQEKDKFEETFGSPDNPYAAALEYYFTKSGELKSTCLKIHALVAESMSQLDAETTRIRQETLSAGQTGTDSGQPGVHTQQPGNQTDGSSSSQQGSNTSVSDKLLSYVNDKRSDAGLSAVGWDSADESAVRTRAGEMSISFSPVRPDGSDAFTAYTDEVMTEMRLENISTIEDIYNCGEDYFLMDGLVSFTYARQGSYAVVVFVW